MMGLISLTFPAIVFCLLREKLLVNEKTDKKECTIRYILEFICGYALINTAVVLTRMFYSKIYGGGIFEELNRTPLFAMKYLALGLVFATLLPFAEKLIRCFLPSDIRLSFKPIRLSEKAKAIIVVVYAFVMTFHHFIRIFDNAIWYDEATAILYARSDTLAGVLNLVMKIEHVPFHYVFLWICCKLFGESGLVYHLSNFIPYVITVIIMVTVVRKWFGNKATVILITFSTLLGCAVTYNLEIRMYTWCQLFTFLAYLMAYGIYKTSKNKYYILMTLFSAGAIYSHYFALSSMGLLYAVMFVYFVFVSRKQAVKVFLSGVSTLILFSPWPIYSLLTKGRVVHNWNIQGYSWYSCFEFVFHSKYSMLLLAGFFAATIVTFVYSLGIAGFQKTHNGSYQLSLKLFPDRIDISPEWIWILSGIVAAFGTIIAAKTYGYFRFNIITLRYFFPTFIIVWLIFGISVSRLRLSSLWGVLLIAFVFVTCYPTLYKTIRTERYDNARVARTLKATAEIDSDDTIYTNNRHFPHLERVFYLDTVSSTMFGEDSWSKIKELPEVDKSINNWLFLNEPISEEILDNIEGQGLCAKLVMANGYLGDGNFWIYKLVDNSEYDYYYSFRDGQNLVKGKDSKKGIRYLYNGGISSGPYIKLYPGTYTVEIKGRNLDKAELECGVEAEESESGSKDVFFVMDELSVTPTSATYSFTIDRTYKNVETRVLNNTDDIVSIESIYIKRTNVTK